MGSVSVMADLSALLRAAATAHHPTDRAASPHPSAEPVASAVPASSVPWSDAQEEFLNSRAHRIVLTALAGSGKTQALLEYARRRPHHRWTVLTLSAAVARHIAAHAPSHVAVRTVHSLAFARYGAPIQHKLRDHLAWSAVAPHVRLPWAASRLVGAPLRSYAAALLDGLEHFAHNADPALSFAVCDPAHWTALRTRYPDVSWEEAGWEADAAQVWRAMLDPKSSCPTTHDTYVKRFCLAGESWPTAHWLLDEAQDWSECVRAAWADHVAHGVRAGDPFQAIYTWRAQRPRPWRDPSEAEYRLAHSHRQGTALEPWVGAQLRPLSNDQRWFGAPNRLTTVETPPETPETLVAWAPTLILADRWADLAPWIDPLRAAGRCPVVPDGVSAAARRAGVDAPERSAAPLGGPQVVLSSIHAAKGVESDRVWIADATLTHAAPDPAAWATRHRLAYVALTRGRSGVRVPPHWPQSPSAPSDPFADS